MKKYIRQFSTGTVVIKVWEVKGYLGNTLVIRTQHPITTKSTLKK